MELIFLRLWPFPGRFSSLFLSHSFAGGVGFVSLIAPRLLCGCGSDA